MYRLDFQALSLLDLETKLLQNLEYFSGYNSPFFRKILNVWAILKVIISGCYRYSRLY